MGQLDLSHFQRPQKSELKALETPQLEQYTPTPQVLSDECRVREGDIIPPPKKDGQNQNQNQNQTQEIAFRVPNALRGIDLSSITSRAQLLCSLTNNIPQNEYNLPRFIYRPDLLDHHLFSAQKNEDPLLENERFREMQDQLDSATIKLDFYEGFPSIDGSPIWQKLPFESPTDFDVFERYTKIPGARQLGNIVNTSSNGGPTLQEAQELYHLYFWGFRTLAHDTFAIAHYQRLKQQRILSTDNVHFLEAEKLLSNLQAHFNEINWELVKDPQVFVTILEKVTKLQRMALGQSATGEKTAQTPSLELIMRNLTAGQENLKPQESSQKGAMEILSDPTLTDKAQELIIRYNGW